MEGQNSHQAIIEGLKDAFTALEFNMHSSTSVQSQEQERESLENENRSHGQAIAIRFIRERSLPDQQVHFVIIEKKDGQQEYWFCCMRRDSLNHWEFAGGGEVYKKEEILENSFLMLNLASIRQKNGFWAGASFLNSRFGVERVRLSFREGIVLEDTVQSDVVLFITDEAVTRPVQAEFYDRTGNRISIQSLPH